MTESEKMIFDIHQKVGEIHAEMRVQKNELKHITLTVDKHDAVINKLDDAHNQTIGKRTIISALFATLGAGVVSIVSHIWK